MRFENATIEWVPVEELVPYDNNAKRHTRQQIDAIEASIREFGFRAPVVAWHDEDGRPVVVAGHARTTAARNLGMEKVPVVFCDDLDDAQRRALTLVDNQTTMMTGWDEDMLAYELDTLAETFDMTCLGFTDDNFVSEDVIADGAAGEPDRFSPSLGHVDYEPSGIERRPEELFSQTDRFDSMIEELDSPEEIKEMLRTRAKWFCEFRYDKIADYYCQQASPEEQRAFEALALVLLDRDGMIENGFSDLVIKYTEASE